MAALIASMSFSNPSRGGSAPTEARLTPRHVYPAASRSEVIGANASGECQAPGTSTMVGFGFAMLNVVV